MISIIATILMTRANLGPKAAKLASWGILFALVLSVLAIGKCTYDRRLIADHDAKVTQKTLTTDTKAKDKAAEQRVTDTLAIDAAQKGRDDEIAKAPHGKPSDAAVRLGCERLRKAGTDTSGIAACS